MNTETEERLLLKNIPLLGYLPEETLADPRYCAVKKYAKGETIFLEGSENDNIYILLEGLIKLVIYTADGKERILHFATEGDFFGDISVKFEKVSAVARIPSDVVAIPKTQFKKLLQNHEFATHFIAMLYHQNNLYQEKVLLKSIKSAKERLTVVNEILSGIPGIQKLSDQEIGDFCSLERETVGRTKEVLTFKLTKNERKERNKRIREDSRSKTKPRMVELAQNYNLSPSHIWWIIHKWKE